MLGVQHLTVLTDSDKAGKQAREGAEWKLSPPMEVTCLVCPASDPNNALRAPASAANLLNLLGAL